MGPIIAFAPAVLVALAQAPMLAVWTAVLYIGIQLVESNLITPLLQRQLISMPPAFLLVFQVLAGSLAGLVGVLVAAPLLATIMTLMQCLYVEGVLGKKDAS